VARAEGVSPSDLPDKNVDEIFANALQFYGPQLPQPSLFKPSMLVDLEHSRPIEVEAIIGGIVRKARDLAVETPRCVLLHGFTLTFHWS
jgi:2-dehydropantoate 2-reductase